MQGDCGSSFQLSSMPLSFVSLSSRRCLPCRLYRSCPTPLPIPFMSLMLLMSSIPSMLSIQCDKPLPRTNRKKKQFKEMNLTITFSHFNIVVIFSSFLFCCLFGVFLLYQVNDVYVHCSLLGTLPFFVATINVQELGLLASYSTL